MLCPLRAWEVHNTPFLHYLVRWVLKENQTSWILDWNLKHLDFILYFIGSVFCGLTVNVTWYVGWFLRKAMANVASFWKMGYTGICYGWDLILGFSCWFPPQETRIYKNIRSLLGSFLLNHWRPRKYQWLYPQGYDNLIVLPGFCMWINCIFYFLIMRSLKMITTSFVALLYGILLIIE